MSRRLNPEMGASQLQRPQAPPGAVCFWLRGGAPSNALESSVASEGSGLIVVSASKAVMVAPPERAGRALGQEGDILRLTSI